jgi:hypothetical protein
MPTPQEIEQELKRQAAERAEDQKAAHALAAPLPGPLKEAFDPAQDIPVAGRWTVRPFYDIDYHWLALLEHPLERMMRDQVAGRDSSDVDFFPMGPQMWTLAWVMTRPVKVVKAAMKDRAKLREDAEDEFGTCRIGELQEIAKAVTRQVDRYWSTAVGYKSKPTAGEEGSAAADAQANPSQSSPPQPTGSAG